MPEITIKNFSCLRSATFQLRRLNVIIGPQGSGKSVTTKLIYFFADIFQDAMRHAEDDLTFSEYKRHLQKTFSIWFPPSAWGADRFSINYTDGELSVRVMRRTSGGSVSEDITITFSKPFETSYNNALKIFSESREVNFGKSDADQSFTRDTLEISWRAREEVIKTFKKSLGESTVVSQTFIPAGRAFFTSIGRLVAGIEHAGSLDPATLKFAKIFANWRDQSESFRPRFVDTNDFHGARQRIMNDLFGGTVQSKRDSEFIEMKDGRRVPFSSLSSGQQELLPIWYFLDNMMLMDAYFSSRSKRSIHDTNTQLIYIEEPEAHLFPEAQSLLLDVMVEVVLGGNRFRSLILTTHSPYIMSKLNVLLKAGQISRRKKKNKELGEIVDRSRWLQATDVAVLSIVNGELRSIMDDGEELIDAAFLDSISDVISEQFSALLELEEEI